MIIFSRSLPKVALSFSELGSASANDIDNEPDQIESNNNSKTSNNKDLVTINEFLKEFEMSQNCKK